MARRRRIALYLAVIVMLAALYRYRLLPERVDVLLDYFLYMSIATTVTPLPTPPVIIYAATKAPVMVVALLGALGTAIAYLIEYAVIGRVLALERLGRVRENRVYLRLARLFDRLPFISLTIAAFLPLPVDGVRLIAIARRYDRSRFALAAFLGRVPRYALIAALGYSLRFFVPSGPAAAGEWRETAMVAGPVAERAVSEPAPAVSEPGPEAPGPEQAAAQTSPASGSEPVRPGQVAPAPTSGEEDPGATQGESEPDDPELESLLDRLDRALASLDDAEARFHQERWSPVFDEPERYSGELWFRRPGDLVLCYKEPAAQEMYIDSTGVWIYLVKEGQAQRYPFTSSAERDAAIAVLWQPSEVLARLYRVARAPSPPPGESAGDWLMLVPRGEEIARVVKAVYMRVGPTSGLSDCVVVEQRDGDRVRLEVDEIERNPGLPDRRFHFEPPPGVEVVHF